MRVEQFKSIHIDLQKGIFEVNGRDISKSGHKLSLECSNGEWTLVVSEDTLYTTNVRKTKE